MTSLKIVQSQSVFNVLNLNTLRAAVEDGVQVFKDDVNGLTIPAANFSLDEVLVVLPITPAVGDTVVSILEGELVTGMIVNSEGLAWAIALGSGLGIIKLARNQFHVTATSGSIPNDSLSVGDEVVVVKDDGGSFPYGTRATIQNITQTKGIPSVTVVLAKNNLEWTWDASKVDFRFFDKTVIDFNFDGEVETVLTTAVDVAPESYTEETLDDVINEILEQSIGGSTVDLAEDLQNEHLDVAITDAEGNAIAWADLPAEVQDALGGVIGQLTSAFTGDVNGQDEVTDVAPGSSSDDLTDVFGYLFSAAADERQKDELISDLAGQAVEANVDHNQYVADGLDEIEEFNNEAIRSLALALNLLGRTIQNRSTVDPALADQLLQIKTLLSAVRNDQFAVSKAILDINTDTLVNQALQENIENTVALVA